MFTILSLVTGVKDYVEIVHKLIETNTSNSFEIDNYYDFGAIFTYLIISGKEILSTILTFRWLQNVWSLPLIVPDVASAMISEISVLDGYLHNAFTFLETPISYGNQNVVFYGIEKFSIGFVNSIFLCLPTSTAHIITLRRFVMQGIEAGYLAGLGTLAGNILWIGSILFGFRFIVIPWLSLDVFRYALGFLLLIKYMWDSYSEKRTVLEDLSKSKIFLLNFLLAFTEQATIYPFLSNLSIGSDATLLESFPTGSFFEYALIHLGYLVGLAIGGLTLLQFTCWFWENPAFNIYMWSMSSLKMTNRFSQKFVNLCFLYLTMFFAISNISYFGLDYTITNPLGLVHEDRLIDQKNLFETAFLNTKASDRNTRRNRGRHGRRERWKRRVRRYRTFDASLYDQGSYDLFTIEDLNYGFDRFWLRRKIRNHRVRFRFFPGPWMRSFKKQLARPRLESFMGPRVEFFRILFEQAYHPEFHEFRPKAALLNGVGGTFEKRSFKQSFSNSPEMPKNKASLESEAFQEPRNSALLLKNFQNKNLISFYSEKNKKTQTRNLMKEYSALRKFIRKVKTRTNTAQILSDLQADSNSKKNSSILVTKSLTKPIYSKRWKQIFSKISHDLNDASTLTGRLAPKKFLTTFYDETILNSVKPRPSILNYFQHGSTIHREISNDRLTTFKQNAEKILSKKDRQILRYKTFLLTNNEDVSALDNRSTIEKTKPQAHLSKIDIYKPLTLVHPMQFYLQKEQAFQKKMKFYGTKVFRNFGVENNAPYYRVMMKKFFYYYKPTLRWESTMRNATMRKARRKGPRIPRKLNVNKETEMLSKSLSGQTLLQVRNNAEKENKQTVSSEIFSNNFSQKAKTKMQRPTHFYSLVSKRATRYRYQIYKDVLQHWYYAPFNRLLLKFDVDSFIRRQPSAHFFTKKEENLLHLKRSLLSDYYNTLRWYVYMQHYNSMKTNIGKTKSFANRSYNQQFFGTFKKIRHLFAITPSLTNNTILKFDQPLFNEYENREKNTNIPSSFYNSSIIHEELLADDDLYFNVTSRKTLPEDLTNQTTKIMKKYLEIATPARQAYIKTLVDEQNYSELTNFLFKGRKIRGTVPITNESLLLNQEKEYLLTLDETKLEKEKMHAFFHRKMLEPSENLSISGAGSIYSNNLWISLMKISRNMLYNQEALKIYVSGRVEKLEKQKKRQQKTFQTRFDNMKNWVNLRSDKKTNDQFETTNNISGLTTSLQKAVKEGIDYQTSGKFNGKTSARSNLRNNRKKILMNLPILNSFVENVNARDRQVSTAKVRRSLNTSLNLKNHLNNRVKWRALQTLEAEQNLRETFSSMQNLLKIEKPNESLQNVNPNVVKKIIHQTFLPFRWISISMYETLESLVNSKNGKYLLTPFRYPFEFFMNKQKKNLNAWKHREVVLSTRKKIRRKIYRVLDQKKQIKKRSNVNELERLNIFGTGEPLRQKRDAFESFETGRRQKSWKVYENQTLKPASSLNLKNFENHGALPKSSKTIFSSKLGFLTFEKNFQRKRTRSRRYRRFKGRGPIKKHTLAEKLKRQFKLLKRYGQKEAGQDKKMEILQMITKRKYDPNSFFEARLTKQRRTRQSKHRYWKKHKRQKYLQIKRKQRKQRRSTISKLRVLNKEFKRIQGNLQIKKWWSASFIPNFIATTDGYWKNEKDKQIKQELSALSVAEILERDRTSNNRNTDVLQLGDQDFKPLSIPQSLQLRKELTSNGQLKFGNERVKNQELPSTPVQNLLNTNLFDSEKTNSISKIKTSENRQAPNTLLSELSYNLLSNQTLQPEVSLDSNIYSKPLGNINPIPFYAGWDENSRQFIVTNRLLSRKEAGYSMTSLSDRSSPKLRNESVSENFKGFDNETMAKNIHFTKAPLQGMNAATTLYWQIPFTTYDPDQFFALGMDGFSPLAWRFFHFKHAKETTKPMLVQNIFYNNQKIIKDKSLLSYNIQLKMLLVSQSKAQASTKNEQIWSNPSDRPSNNAKKNQARKIQKRQKRVKKHPRPPVWFPSGPLANQILPVHYIYVFYKRSRLPRDRYIGRRLRRSEDPKSSFLNLNFTKMIDFTLRKRVKPIRKYHRKRNLNKNQENSHLIRRRSFKGFLNENVRFRPIPKGKLTTQTDILNASLLKTKHRKKTSNKQQISENLRIRQLRRRIQRQVLRPIWRYKPRPGGFVWPGDYLRFESVKSPVLKTHPDFLNSPSVTDPSNLQLRKKKRRNIQEWQIQPKKYLLEKHNLKILKKRMQKSQNNDRFLRSSPNF